MLQRVPSTVRSVGELANVCIGTEAAAKAAEPLPRLFRSIRRRANASLDIPLGGLEADVSLSSDMLNLSFGMNQRVYGEGTKKAANFMPRIC
jgi:hypothetical protein